MADLEPEITRLLKTHKMTGDRQLEFKIRKLLVALLESNLDRKIQVHALLATALQSQMKSHLLAGNSRSNTSGSLSAVGKSRQITATLRHAVQESTNEIQRSAQLAQSLHQSTEILGKSGAEHQGIHERITASRRLLLELAGKDETDRYLLATGLFIFLATVSYIVYKRFWIPFF